MQFPKFWARSSGEYSCWGWSDQSAEDAKRLAQSRSIKMAAAIKAGGARNKVGYYAVGPLREEVLQELGSAEARSVVTRNAYGCKVLNTSQIMFVDIDVAQKETQAGGFFAGLFGKKSNAEEKTEESAQLTKLESWLRINPSWGFRAYRTAGGLRLIATQGFFDPVSSECQRVFEALGCDPLYQRLCKTQASFRARLTPKPWRCDFYAAAWRWPWVDDKSKNLYLKWQAGYEKNCQNYSTCKFVAQYGAHSVQPEIAEIIKFHDQICKVESELPLA